MHIEPPLKWAEFKDSKHYGLDRAREAGLGVHLLVKTEHVETDDGPMERRTAVALEFAWTEWVKLYDIVEELQALVDAHPDHDFVGEFQGTGTAFGDMWLLRVNENRKVERILPTITWPDGTVLHNERYQ
jgi:hypothetical protein